MKQTLEEYADIAITDLEEKLGIFIVKQKPLVKERIVQLLQSVREATIKETITVCGWNLNWGCNGANIEIEEVHETIKLNEIQL